MGRVPILSRAWRCFNGDDPRSYLPNRGGGRVPCSVVAERRGRSRAARVEAGGQSLPQQRTDAGGRERRRAERRAGRRLPQLRSAQPLHHLRVALAGRAVVREHRGVAAGAGLPRLDRTLRRHPRPFRRHRSRSRSRIRTAGRGPTRHRLNRPNSRQVSSLRPRIDAAFSSSPAHRTTVVLRGGPRREAGGRRAARPLCSCEKQCR